MKTCLIFKVNSKWYCTTQYDFHHYEESVWFETRNSLFLQKLRYFRGSRFSQSTALHCSLPSKFYFFILTIILSNYRLCPVPLKECNYLLQTSNINLGLFFEKCFKINKISILIFPCTPGICFIFERARSPRHFILGKKHPKSSTGAFQGHQGNDQGAQRQSLPWCRPGMYLTAPKPWSLSTHWDKTMQ